MKDKDGFIREMRAALYALQSAIMALPEGAERLLPVAEHLDAAMGKLAGTELTLH